MITWGEENPEGRKPGKHERKKPTPGYKPRHAKPKKAKKKKNKS